MVVNRDRELLLCLVLSDYVLIQEGLHLLRRRQLRRSNPRGYFGPIVFQNRVADSHTLVADVSTGIIRWGRDELGDRVLRFMAKRATKRFVGTAGCFHDCCNSSNAVVLERISVYTGFNLVQCRQGCRE